MYEIYKIDTSNLTDLQLDELYCINKKMVTKYNLLDQFQDKDSYKKLFLSSFDGEAKELFVLKENSSICGIVSCIQSADWGGKEQYKLGISLCNLTIEASLLEVLNQFVAKKLAQHEELAVVTYNDELEMLIKGYSYKTNLKSNCYTLKKGDIDIELLNTFMKKCEEKNTDLSIRYTDLISEEYIEQYCTLFTETMEDMTDVNEDGYVEFSITPEKQRQINDSNKKRNITHHCYMIFNSNNEMIAKSNVSVNNNDPRFPYQFMIGVKRAYRGRALGKWLYAAMYKRLFESVNFEKTLVCHHPENKHAIDISEWVGYRLNYKETIYVLYKQ